MEFQTVYDISTQPYPFGWAIPVAGAALALTATWIGYRRRTARSAAGGWALLVMLGLFSAAMYAESLEHARLGETQQHGGVAVVEGRIAAHQVWTTTERRLTGSRRRSVSYEHERFSVAGVPFRFTRGADVDGFRNGGETPVELMDGMYVRVHYGTTRPGGSTPEHQILKLEVAGHPAAAEREPAGEAGRGRS